ncbi:MAG: hemerythrin family protein [Anaeromyxobacter sp.]
MTRQPAVTPSTNPCDERPPAPPCSKRPLEVGCSVMDGQHAQIYDCADTLFDALISGQELEKIGTIAQALCSACHDHFATEERLMETLGYPDATGHAGEHLALEQRLRTLAAGLAARPLEHGTVVALRELLFDWLVRHVSVADRALAEHATRAEA